MMSWKTTLYDYVHRRNQMELDYSVESVLTLVKDNAYLEAEALRLVRKREMDQARGITPSKRETRLSLLRAADREGQVVADVKLRSLSVSSLFDTPSIEERIDFERVTLSAEEDSWSITSIEARQAERSLVVVPSGGGGLLEADETFNAVGLMRVPSSPLLRPEVQPPALRARYDRARAAAYADAWWEKGNPNYLTFEVDCTNFVSQCLFAGGAPMNYTDRRDSGWWYKGRIGGQEQWSFSWAVSESLQFYLTKSRTGLRAEEVDRAELLDIGDVIFYDWDGDGRFQHSTIVTAKDASGQPLVNAHTVSSKHRFWSYRDSPAWTTRTVYRFLRIADTL
jgi:hypothetical protein